MELVKLLPIRRYSVVLFLYRGPLGILGSDRKQYTAKAIARGRENLLHFPLVLMNRLM